MSFLLALTQQQILYIAVAAIVVLILVVVLENVLRAKKRKHRKESEKQAQTGVIEQKEVRYSASSAAFDETCAANATFTEHDIILSKNVTYTAGKELKPGKYTMLSVTDVTDFNVRVNGLVGEYHHGSPLILGEGDTVCPVSHSIVLR